MSTSILYLECNSGISGDMTVAALLDLGADRQVLTDALNSLPLTGYSIQIKDVYKSGIRACDFAVILDKELENHDHDMEYLYGIQNTANVNPDAELHAHADVHTQTHCHADVSGHGPAAVHAQTHCHADASGHNHADAHAHPARNLQDITAIINAGNLTSGAKELALRIFSILARAEASVHGKRIEEVHFHEVGAVDSIVDIVAAAVCMDNLHPEQVVVSALTEGCGQIRCQHGLIPVPVPAVAKIAEQERLTLRLTGIQGELVTPTGAAIAAAVRTQEQLPDPLRICRVGLGAGKRSYAAAGVLRAMLIEAEACGKQDCSDVILELETNLDDCTGEALSYTMQQLMKAGALDVFCVPIYMKKNRPAYLLKVICAPEKRTEMERIIFQNTTTIGIRRREMQRTKLARQIISLETPWGNAEIKICRFGEEVRCYPENDSISCLSEQNGIGFSKMYGMVQAYADANVS